MSAPKPAVPPPPERIRPVTFQGETRRPRAPLTRRLLAERTDVDVPSVLGRRGYRVRWRLRSETPATRDFGRNKLRAVQYVEALHRRHGDLLEFAVVETRLESDWKPIDTDRSPQRAQPPRPRPQAPAEEHTP